MATVTWLDVSGDLSATANYSGAAVPSDGDTLLIPTSNKTVTTAPTTLRLIDFVNVRFGRAVTGQWGTAAAPVQIGACTGTVEIDSPLAGLIALDATSTPKLIVHDCGDVGSGGLLVYDGTITDLIIFGGGYINLGASAGAITNLLVIGGNGSHPSPHVVLDAGATVTNLYAEMGVIDCYSNAVTNYELSGTARLNIRGDSSIGSTSIQVRNRARVEITANGGTHTLIETFESAEVDMAKDTRERTVTTARANGRSIIRAGRHITATNVVLRGGRIDGLNSTISDSLPGAG